MSPIDLREALAALFAADPPRGCANESVLCDRIALLFRRIPGCHAAREYRLDTRSRLDFLAGDGVLPGIAVEVKVQGGVGQVTRQLMRYADDPRVGGVLLITTRAAHRGLPETMRGKPVACLWIGEFLL